MGRLSKTVHPPFLPPSPACGGGGQENCIVRGLVHFSAQWPLIRKKSSAETMDLSPSPSSSSRSDATTVAWVLTHGLGVPHCHASRSDGTTAAVGFSQRHSNRCRIMLYDISWSLPGRVDKKIAKCWTALPILARTLVSQSASVLTAMTITAWDVKPPSHNAKQFSSRRSRSAGGVRGDNGGGRSYSVSCS